MDKTAKTESGKNVAEIATQKATGDNKEKIQEKPSKVLDLIGAMYQMKYGRHGQRRKKKWAVGWGVPGIENEGMVVMILKKKTILLIIMLVCTTLFYACGKKEEDQNNLPIIENSGDKITEAEDTDEIQEINSQAAYVSEAERQEDIEVNEKDRNLADGSDLIEK